MASSASSSERPDGSISASSSSSAPPSLVRYVLATSRRELWQANLPKALHPIRVFFIDPSLQICNILLPPAAAAAHADRFVARVIRIFYLTPQRWILQILSTEQRRQEIGRESSTNLARSAGRELLHASRQRAPVCFSPPSDAISAIQGALAFAVSATADIVQAVLNPKKVQKWLAAVSAFRAYVAVSGVGDELEEAMMKPLFRGRLMGNLKILNDIQEMKDAERVLTAKDESIHSVDKEVREGCVWMRFATAAYGTNMVASAIDRDATFEDLSDHTKSIAFHTRISEEDIMYVSIDEGGDVDILRHFIAADHSTKSVVLAIRGTLSLTGALIDMQAMDCDYCGGLAHKGIAEQATFIWDATGERLLSALNDFPDYALVLTGHSLGAGAACLLHLKIYQESLVPADRRVWCYGFAPPPVYAACATTAADNSEVPPSIQRAMEHCICYVHDNDCVPLLSVAAVRRLARLMDAVDNCTEYIWFWRRWRYYWEWESIPQHIVDAVNQTIAASDPATKEVGLACCSMGTKMMIPARVVVWIKKDMITGTFEPLPCAPTSMAKLDIFVSQDMVNDHLPEMYEDALDAVVENL